jgi:hypothetical protein
MKRMGMNVARVFVTFGSFYTQPDHLDASGLATFDRMLELADKTGIYLHPTGPLDPGGKPADEDQQSRWCRRLVEVTAPMACGWINWGLYDTPEATDVSRLTGLITTNGVDKALYGKKRNY